MHIDCAAFEIRSYRLEDKASLAKHADNPRVAENLRNRFPCPYTEKDAQDWLSTALRQDPETNFAIAVDGEIVGAIGLQLGEDVYRQSAEIGYWLGEDHWGRDIGSRAVRVFTDWGFSTFGLIRIYAYVFEANPASIRVLEKAGYRLEGRMRRAVVKNGRVMDQFLYAKLASDRSESGAGLKC